MEMLDLTGREYEKYFMCDTMHLGWKGGRLIKRLSIIITTAKEWVFAHPAARYSWYLLAVLGLFLFWLCSPEGEVAFVYSAF